MHESDQFIVEPETNQTPPGNDPLKPGKGAAFGHFIVELLRTAVIVGVVAWVLRFFVFQPFVVEGSSMFPRFETNDFLVVDKFSYHFHRPDRGDIIVFKFPGTEKTTQEINYVKRVIGKPGDTVIIEGGQVKVVTPEHPEGVVLDEPYVSPNNQTNLPAGSKNNAFVVSPHTYFVLGDNRKASSDSREWGLLPEENIIGRAVLQALPLSRASFVSHAHYSQLP